jgi:ribosomal protein S21
VNAGDEEVDGEELLQRFRREVARAGVMEEIRWRRRHEDARDKRKRKARSAARRFRRR